MKEKHHRDEQSLEYIQHVWVGPFAGYLWLQRETETLYVELVDGRTSRTVGLVEFYELADLKPLAKCIRAHMKEQPARGDAPSDFPRLPRR